MVMKTKIGATFYIGLVAGDPRSLVKSSFKRAEEYHHVKLGRIRRKGKSETQFGVKFTIYEATVVRLT